MLRTVLLSGMSRTMQCVAANHLQSWGTVMLQPEQVMCSDDLFKINKSPNLRIAIQRR